jgi:hypothetical protein
MFRKLLCVLTLLTVAPYSFAHPMGNFSVNHYSKIALERDGVKVTYIIDLAEIPTYQELQQGDVTADVADPSIKRYVESRGQEFARGLTLMLDGKRLPLKLLSSQVIFPPGAGGLPTMKMGFVYQANQPLPSDEDHHQSAPACTLQYVDNNYPGHAGWKEIVTVATPNSMVISTSVPKTDRSAELTNYPTDLLNSPPQDLSATIQFRFPAIPVPPTRAKRVAPTVRAATAAPPVAMLALTAAAPTLHLQANQQTTPRNAFTELITTRNLSFWFLITAAFIAFGLGALHALEPGH